MSGENDVTSEAARVLGEHYPEQTSYDAGELHGCHCGWEVPRRPSLSMDGDWAAYWAHQAAMLAEAGLLDDAARPAGIERWEVALALTPYMDTQTRYCATADVWALITRMTLAQEAQIAAQEPAGATQGGSGDSRASGGLDGAAVSAEDAALIEGANQAMIRLGLRPLTPEEIAERFGKDAP